MRRVLLIALAFCLYASAAWAVPAFDAASSATATTSTSTSHSHTASGSDRVVYCSLLISVATGSDPSSAMTYGGTAMSKIETNGLASNQVQILFRLIAPATGSQTVASSWTGNASAINGCASYTGVHQTTPEGTLIKASQGVQTSSSIDVTSATGELVVDFLATRDGTDGTFAEGAGQTSRQEASHGIADFLHSNISEEAGGASVTMSWSWTGNGNRFHIGVPLKPADGYFFRRRNR